MRIRHNDPSWVLQRELMSQGRWNALAIVAWGAAVVTAALAARFFRFNPVIPLTIGATAACADTARRFIQFGKEPIARFAAAQKKGGDQDVPPFPPFRLPLDINALTPEHLGEINANQPMRYLAEGGGRFGVSFELSELQPHDLALRLKVLASRYPHLSHLEFCHGEKDFGYLSDLIKNFPNLKHITFYHCSGLKEAFLSDLVDTYPSLKRVDVEGCHAITPLYTEELSRQMVVTFPNGFSNFKQLLREFHNEVDRLAHLFLEKIIEERLPHVDSETADKIRLLQRKLTQPLPQSEADILEHKRSIHILIRELHRYLNPMGLESDVYKRLMEPICQQLKEMVRRPYFKALEFPFGLDLSHSPLTDAFLGPILYALGQLGVYLTSLNVSHTYIDGGALERGSALPIGTLKATHLDYLKHLQALERFSGVVEVDLSYSSIDTASVVDGVGLAARLAWLNLTGCVDVKPVVVIALAKQLARTLELLQIEEHPDIASKHVKDILKHISSVAYHPLLFSWTQESWNKRRLRRVDVSQCKNLDPKVIRYFEKLDQPARGPIRSLAFAPGSRLEARDFAARDGLHGLFGIRGLRPYEFDMEGSDLGESILPELPRQWPLQRFIHKEFEARIELVDEEIPGRAKKIAIKGHFTPSVIAFLKGYQEIRELSFSNIQEIGERSLVDIALLCEEKNVTKLDLSNTPLTADHLQTLEGEPNEAAKRLLRQLEELDLSQIPFSDDLWPSWRAGNAPNEPTCAVALQEGEFSPYFRQPRQQQPLSRRRAEAPSPPNDQLR